MPDPWVHSVLPLCSKAYTFKILHRLIFWHRHDITTHSFQLHNRYIWYSVVFCQNRLDQPVKRLKIELTPKTETVRSQHSPGASHHAPNTNSHTPSPSAPPHDPYEFSEESSTNVGDFSTSRSYRSSRDDSFPRPSPYKQVDILRNIRQINQQGHCY